MSESALTAIELDGWSCCARPPGAVTHPDQLAAVRDSLAGASGSLTARSASEGWLPAAVPGTAAAALHAAGLWDFGQPLDLDAEDWWYRTSFAAPDVRAGHPCHLCLDGLATLAEIWLNGRRLLTTDNMFRAYRVNVAADLRPRNELVLGFRSLGEELKRKRPRPRWKTNLVSHQQLRWHRASLLGRIPGWSPPVPAVGPWRAVRLETGPLVFTELRLTTGLESGEGVVTLHARVQAAAPPGRVVLDVGGRLAPVEVQPDADGWLLRASLRFPSPPLWWPHTHGEQALVDCSLYLNGQSGRLTVPCGRVGFRQLTVPRPEAFSLEVNGVPVYCRGACWTVGDVLTPGAAEAVVSRDLRLARDAGVNMLRVGGTMVYESDHFYRLCDELGILVWQDFMFANMDYPVEDRAFAANVEAEARHQLGRLSAHPCVAVLCGNSEVEQQAAMLGVPRPWWRNDWFAGRLPALCAAHSPGVPYVPSTPSGGSLPFHVREGVAHYYGVGAYLRSPQELRQADVKFAPECLAFANVPEPEAVSAITAGAAPAPHHPCWKQRVPRDTGAGWDFEDVRDHYLQQLFGVDPVKLRCFDMPRYLQLSRVVPGEMMAQVFAEWRGGHGNNGGGLVWFFKDLWPAAGWGVVDSLGTPKAAYYYLRRSWAPRQITLTDEGLDGLHLHLINETAEPLEGRVELLLLRDGHVPVARQEAGCRLPPRGRQTLDGDGLLGGFLDATYAYRFGPPKHDLAAATLFDHRGDVVSEAFHFVRSGEPSPLAAKVEAVAEPVGDGCYELTLHSDQFLRSVSFDVAGFLPDDNYLHLLPSRRKRVRFRPAPDGAPRFRGHVEALNLREPVAIRLQGTSP